MNVLAVIVHTGVVAVLYRVDDIYVVSKKLQGEGTSAIACGRQGRKGE